MKLKVGDYIRFRGTGKVAKVIEIGPVEWANDWPEGTLFYHMEVHPDDLPDNSPAEIKRMVALEPVEVADSAALDDPYGFDKIIL